MMLSTDKTLSSHASTRTTSLEWTRSQTNPRRSSERQRPFRSAGIVPGRPRKNAEEEVLNPRAIALDSTKPLQNETNICEGKSKAGTRGAGPVTRILSVRYGSTYVLSRALGGKVDVFVNKIFEQIEAIEQLLKCVNQRMVKKTVLSTFGSSSFRRQKTNCMLRPNGERCRLMHRKKCCEWFSRATDNTTKFVVHVVQRLHLLVPCVVVCLRNSSLLNGRRLEPHLSRSKERCCLFVVGA